MPVAVDPPDLSAEAIFHSPPRFSQRGTPTWEVAYFFPPQGTSHQSLVDNRYVVHGEYRPGQVAESVILPGLALDVARLFGVHE